MNIPSLEPSTLREDLHAKRCARLQEQIAKSQGLLALHHRKSSPPHITRSLGYKNETTLLDLSDFDHILQFDRSEAHVWVEPTITMRSLLNATLARGMIPALLPEFPGITLGGAIAGGGIESTSYQHGLLHSTCLQYELLNGSGEILSLSPEQESSSALFHGISSAFGSLGLLTAIHLSLIPAHPYVELTLETCGTMPEWIERMCHRSCEKAIQFIEGLFLAPDKILLITGKMEKKTGDRPLSLHRARDPWFAQLIEERVPPKGERVGFSLSLTDYLFRYDRGAFWMGRYLSSLRPLLAYLLKKPLKEARKALHTNPLSYPSLPLRLAMGKLFKSDSLYRGLHAIPETRSKELFLIQDTTLPLSQLSLFIEEIVESYQILPLWLCPIRPASAEEFLSPHFLPSDERLFVNVGIYGIPSLPYDGITANEDLEAKLQRLGGRKALYSSSCYSQEHFWQIYDHERYSRLRHEMHAEGKWLSLSEKVLS